MNNRLSCNPATKYRHSMRAAALASFCLVVAIMPARAGDAPAWMHALVNAPLPPHDDKDNSVQLYSEQVVTVLSADKIRTTVREAYKIVRPGGHDEHDFVGVDFTPRRKITGLRAWCIPAQGKDYEVKEKEALETSLPKIDGSELVSDVRFKVLRIPAADPGNIVGYEYELEEQPYVLQDAWYFQGKDPVREARYTLALPAGWEFKSTWLNAPEVKPTQSGNQWQWVVTNVKSVRPEDEMPPIQGMSGQMIVSFFPAGGSASNKSFADWRQMGTWYTDLISGRREASPEIKQKVGELTAGIPSKFDQMRALAKFVQKDIRYVAIELGIGGWQPHPASEILGHRYGDCKDKATLMSAMLQQIGVESFYVTINTKRGSVVPNVQAHLGFNHAILAVKMPEESKTATVYAAMNHPKAGTLLFFDPTDELTPFGQIRGPLQSNYGLLVTPEGGDLVELPKQPAAMNGIQRTGKLTLDPRGMLIGDVTEVRIGDRAWEQRYALRSVTKDSDRIKPIETLLAHSLGTFQITKATVVNQQASDQPFEYRYSLAAPSYAKYAGNMLILRPRVLGEKSSGLLETKEPRRFPVEFDGPSRDTDTFEIALPAGFEVEDLPPPIDADYSFASYHSKSEMSGNVLRYTRTLEVKELSVPLSKMEDLKRFYRIIASDERNTAVLRPAAH
jgi:uncharacterized protein DUF3857/transglutaminase superfamily protein